MTPLSATYLAYLAVSAYITIVVGHQLHKHGRPFLLEVFMRNATQADAVNHLLLVGYYLTNAALVTQTMTCHVEVSTWDDVLPVLSSKLGWVMLVLAGMHFFNLAVLFGVRQRIWNTP
ncbi:MAG: hypothetical protein NT069_35555, partial [Planctomycetota bacterium]|nr:hypothetical protein [Planctomycetota bacterium]